MSDRVGRLLDEESRAGPDLEFDGLLQGHDMFSKPLAMRALMICFLFHVSIVRSATKTLQRDLPVMVLSLRTLSLSVIDVMQEHVERWRTRHLNSR